MPYPPAIAMEVWDVAPQDWPDVLAEHFRDVWHDPGLWAKKCVEQYGADLICLRLAGCDPVKENRGPQQAAQAVKRVLESVGVPLIVWGTGNDDKDN
jgi:acetyl-CoA decarbonylase/synthase complex subunit delta